MGLAADYVVVGGGTAGAIVARRLADSGATVTLLEAGPTGEHDPRVLALSRWMELVTSELDYDYAVEGERSHELLRFSSARVLGGCSSHNTCIAWRAPDRDMQAWEAAGASGWGPGGTKRYFDRVDERVNVEDSERTNVLASAFLEAARSWGLPLRDFDDPNIADGVGWFRLNKRGDLRMSSAVAYLFPTAEVPATLTISPETTACRLAMDANNATTGVVTTDGTLKRTREWSSAPERLALPSSCCVRESVRRAIWPASGSTRLPTFRAWADICSITPRRWWPGRRADPCRLARVIGRPGR